MKALIIPFRLLYLVLLETMWFKSCCCSNIFSGVIKFDNSPSVVKGLDEFWEVLLAVKTKTENRCTPVAAADTAADGVRVDMEPRTIQKTDEHTSFINIRHLHILNQHAYN